MIRLARVSPERELAVVASLAQRPGTGALVISELIGDAASLGRLQRVGHSRAKSRAAPAQRRPIDTLR